MKTILAQPSSTTNRIEELSNDILSTYEDIQATIAESQEAVKRLVPQLPPPQSPLSPTHAPDYGHGTRVWVVVEIVEDCCGDWKEAIPHLVTGQFWDGEEWLYSVAEETRRYAEPGCLHATHEISAAPWDLILERPTYEEDEEW